MTLGNQRLCDSQYTQPKCCCCSNRGDFNKTYIDIDIFFDNVFGFIHSKKANSCVYIMFMYFHVISKGFSDHGHTKVIKFDKHN